MRLYSAQRWPVNLCDHLAYNLLAYVGLHLDTGDELARLDQVADVDARVIADAAPEAARRVEEESLQE